MLFSVLDREAHFQSGWQWIQTLVHTTLVKALRISNLEASVLYWASITLCPKPREHSRKGNRKTEPERGKKCYGLSFGGDTVIITLMQCAIAKDIQPACLHAKEKKRETLRGSDWEVCGGINEHGRGVNGQQELSVIKVLVDTPATFFKKKI